FDRVNILLACRDVAEAHRAEFENGGKKHADDHGCDHQLRQRGCSFPMSGENHMVKFLQARAMPQGALRSTGMHCAAAECAARRPLWMPPGHDSSLPSSKGTVGESEVPK